MNPARTNFRRGFTLTELLISVGLALLVLYGVNTVFKATADTIGTGQALGEANRTMRAVETNLASDFNPQTNLAGGEVPGTGIVPVVPDVLLTRGYAQPAIAIRCESIVTFLNKADRDADPDADPSTWNPDESGERAMTALELQLFNARAHRVDTLSFFTGGATGTPGLEVGSFRRQTGQVMNGRESLVTNLSTPAQHAWVWYGHARQPNDPDSTDLSEANYYQPGDPASTNNYYAASWVLARKSTLILSRDTAAGTIVVPGGYVFSASGEPMWFYGDSFTAGDMSPVGYGSVARYATAATATTTQENFYPATTGQETIQGSLYDIAAMRGGLGVVNPAPSVVGEGGIYEKFAAAAPADLLLLAQAGKTGGEPSYRFNANPLVGAPLIPQSGQLRPSFKTALNSSILAPACTQFVVEFALDQNADGMPDTNTVTYDPDGTGPAGSTTVSSIQWYGLPRDTGFGSLPVIAPPAGVPLRDSGATATGQFATYVWGPADLATPLPVPTTASPNRPVLIRITVSIADTNNRLQDGMTREFIYRVR